MKQRILRGPHFTISLTYPSSFVFNFKFVSFILANRRDSIFEEKQDQDSVSAMCMTFSLFTFGPQFFSLQRKGTNMFPHQLCRALWTTCYYVCGNTLVHLEENHLTCWSFMIVTSSIASHCMSLIKPLNQLLVSLPSPLFSHASHFLMKRHCSSPHRYASTFKLLQISLKILEVVQQNCYLQFD